MFPSSFKSSVRRAGFTLIELLVAIGVTALLVSLMLSITTNVMSGWNRSSGSLTSGNQARQVLDMINRDLQGAVMKRDTNVWFAATIQLAQINGGDAGMADTQNWTPTAALMGKPAGAIELNAWNTITDPTVYSKSYFIPPAAPGVIPALEDYRFGQGGVWLRFFTAAQDSNSSITTTTGGTTTTTTNTLSGPRAVSYQIIRLPVVAGGSEYRYQLFRSEVGSGNSFSTGYNLFSTTPTLNYESSSPETSPPLTDSNGNIIGEYAAGIIRHPEDTGHNRSMVVANNVIDFGVRIFTRDVNGLLISTPQFPTATYSGFAATSDQNAASSFMAASSICHDFPAVVEVYVRVLTDEGVVQIDNLENGRIPGTLTSWWDIALKNSKVYTRRIEVNANGL